MTGAPAILAIFVGGASSRMGGAPKGRLAAPDTGEPLVDKLVRLGREAALEPVLVGDASAYADLAPGVPRLADDPPGVGPLGGLVAALVHAGARPVVAVACDMPFVTADVLRAIALHPSDAAVVAPRLGREAPFETLLARYDPSRVLPAARAAIAEGRRSLQALLATLEVFSVEPDEALRQAAIDWDEPADLG